MDLTAILSVIQTFERTHVSGINTFRN
jgi:hypothetical protein